jgi:hypothetical protein
MHTAARLVEDFEATVATQKPIYLQTRSKDPSCMPRSGSVKGANNVIGWWRCRSKRSKFQYPVSDSTDNSAAWILIYR